MSTEEVLLGTAAPPPGPQPASTIKSTTAARLSQIFQLKKNKQKPNKQKKATFVRGDMVRSQPHICENYRHGFGAKGVQRALDIRGTGGRCKAKQGKGCSH